MSMWISEPGLDRSYRTTGSGGANFESRFNPNRLTSETTVETGMARRSAIRGLRHACLLSRSI
jgi:hypothetical protein